jgi:hypothetical protein
MRQITHRREEPHLDRTRLERQDGGHREGQCGDGGADGGDALAAPELEEVGMPAEDGQIAPQHGLVLSFGQHYSICRRRLVIATGLQKVHSAAPENVPTCMRARAPLEQHRASTIRDHLRMRQQPLAHVQEG